MLTLSAYHGTRASHVDSIVEAGLRPSIDHDEWLGSGSYFFINGISDARTSAFEWARVESWDKRRRRFVEDDLAIFEYQLTLDPEAIFDLRETEELREFHNVRRSWLRTRIPRRSTHQRRPAGDTYDTQLLNQFKADTNISALISDFHIQLSVRERHFRMDSRIPNVTVLCLSHPVVPPTTIDLVQVVTRQRESAPELENDHDRQA